MKDLIALAGLLLFLVLALVANRVLDASRQERLVIGWSNSLVWSSLGTPTMPRFEATVLSPGNAPRRWIVTGQVAYRNDGGALLQRTYEAAVEQVCVHEGRRECWQLGALSLDGLAVDPSTPLAAEDAPDAARAERAEPLLPPVADAAPAEAEPEETAPPPEAQAESRAAAERAEPFLGPAVDAAPADQAASSAPAVVDPGPGAVETPDTHVVQPGDTLSKIARKYYGDRWATSWQRIYQANRDVIGDDPGGLQIGTTVDIPQ